MEEPTLTPSEELAVEVLVARRRLGNSFWTFEKRHNRTLNSLADKGLVVVMHGIVENTVRARLTDEAFSHFTAAGWQDPIFEQHEQALAQVRASDAAVYEPREQLPRYAETVTPRHRDPLALALSLALVGELGAVAWRAVRVTRKRAS